MKLLLDMNLSPRWKVVLDSAGHETVHWSTAGSSTASDTEIMQFARLGGYTMLTHDLDFGTILATTRGSRPSVIQLRTEAPDPAIIGQQVIAAIRQLRTELEAGVLLTIEPGRTRIRILPLW